MRHPERENVPVARFRVEFSKMCDKSRIFENKTALRRFGISHGLLLPLEQHSLPCAKGGVTRQRDGGIVAEA